MIPATLLAIYGIGLIVAWARIVTLVQRGADPMTLRQAWLPATAYALAWPLVGACALLVMMIGRLRS
ncbi:MAG: hypothetical protein J0L52_00045 [Caulobacterales bacterium]|nr:hypothetical protein [Caulobacterales bacterium]